MPTPWIFYSDNSICVWKPNWANNNSVPTYVPKSFNSVHKTSQTVRRWIICSTEHWWYTTEWYNGHLQIHDKVERSLNQLKRCSIQISLFCNELCKYFDTKYQSLSIQITPWGIQQLNEIYTDLHIIYKHTHQSHTLMNITTHEDQYNSLQSETILIKTAC